MNKTYTLLENNMLQPQAPDIEKAVLGALLIVQTAIDDVAFLLDADMFYHTPHKHIYRAIYQLYQDNHPVDLLTVAGQMDKNGTLGSSGGAVYLSQLTMAVGSAAHVAYHAKIIVEKYVARQMIIIGNNIVKSGYNPAFDILHIISDAENKINSILGMVAGKNDTPHISQTLTETIELAYHRTENARNGHPGGIKTGLPGLDRITYGWQKANLVVLAARPSMGKTAVMLHFAKVAAQTGKQVLIFSLEMSKIKISDRLILSETDISPDKYRNGYLTGSELQEIEAADGKLSKLPLYIDDKSDVSMYQIRAKAKSLHKQGKCDIVLIDYLQLCRESNTGRSREQEVSIMSREAKNIAKTLDIPVILLAQLNREVEKRSGNKTPQLSDLRDSGAIEQDADQVIFIHRPEYYGMELKDKYGNLQQNCGELIIAKNRDGACGKVYFKHNEGMTKIYEYKS